eukprot:656939-Rhodomonas_salina.1
MERQRRAQPFMILQLVMLEHFSFPSLGVVMPPPPIKRGIMPAKHLRRLSAHQHLSDFLLESSIALLGLLLISYHSRVSVQSFLASLSLSFSAGRIHKLCALAKRFGAALPSHNDHYDAKGGVQTHLHDIPKKKR